MRKYFYHTLFGVFLLLGSCKKDLLHWQKVQQLVSNTTCSLNRVKFLSDSVCIISGGTAYSQAEVLRSTDGGNTWAANSYPAAGKTMYGMAIAPNGTIALCGIDGLVMRSADMGATWTVGRVDWQPYFAIAYPTNDTAVMICSILQKQGIITQINNDLHAVSIDTFSFGMNNVYCTSPATAYICGYGALLKSTDSRHSWNLMDISGDDFTAMDFHSNVIWMCGFNGGIYHSTDAGQSWETLRNPNDITLLRYRLLSIYFRDNLNGWACGEGGKVIRTDDGGHHWMEYDSFTTQNLRAMTPCPNGDLLFVGDNGVVFRMTTH